jgi:hypothetical protein
MVQTEPIQMSKALSSGLNLNGFTRTVLKEMKSAILSIL